MRLRADRVNRKAPAATASEEGAEEVINRIGRFLGKSAAVNGLADQAEHDEPPQPEAKNGAPGDVASTELSMPAQPRSRKPLLTRMRPARRPPRHRRSPRTWRTSKTRGPPWPS